MWRGPCQPAVCCAAVSGPEGKVGETSRSVVTTRDGEPVAELPGGLACPRPPPPLQLSLQPACEGLQRPLLASRGGGRAARLLGPAACPPGCSPAPGPGWLVGWLVGWEAPASDAGLPGPPTEPQSGPKSSGRMSLGGGGGGGCLASAWWALWVPSHLAFMGPTSSLPVRLASQFVPSCLHPTAWPASSGSPAPVVRHGGGGSGGLRQVCPRAAGGGFTVPHFLGAGAPSEEGSRWPPPAPSPWPLCAAAGVSPLPFLGGPSWVPELRPLGQGQGPDPTWAEGLAQGLLPRPQMLAGRPRWSG